MNKKSDRNLKGNIKDKMKDTEAIKSHPHVLHSNMFGIGMMLLHVIGLSLLYALVKALTKDFNSSLIVFLYKSTILVCIIPWCLVGGIKSLKTKRIWLHLSRGFLSVCGALCMFYAIKYIGLSDVTAIGFLEQMVLLVISILYFKEKPTKTKLFVLLLSLIGAVLIIKPIFFLSLFGLSDEAPTTGFNTHYIFVFLALAFWSLNSTVIKVLGKTEKTKVQSFYVLLFSSIIAFPVAFMEWRHAGNIGVIEIKYPSHFVELSSLNIEPIHMVYVLMLAACYFIHVVGHFKALKHADLSVVIPFEYTRWIFAAILEYIFFNEAPQIYSYIGCVLIVSGGLYLLRSEHRKIKRKKFMELESEYNQS
jgi:drug/metabolite transporter (DMT)-like permease